ncbi:MAG TPA: hypothetical protein VHL77_05470 [Ferruginibacter sp.]|nr:hypothetical protein [Ferruginibacter sp.]
MRKFCYISFLVFALVPALQAQDRSSVDTTVPLQEIKPPVEDVEVNTQDAVSFDENVLDTSLIKNNLSLPGDSIRNWRNRKEYAYVNYLDSLLKNQKKPKAKPVQAPEGPGLFDSFLSSSIVSIVLWTLAIFFILFIIYRLFLADGVFRRKTKAGKVEAQVEEELITEESDFDALIRQALQAGDYRLAVRYQYLKTLHLLAGRQFIQLAPDKTNYQYVREISNRNHQNEFAALTLNYEYVWYGEFGIEKPLYQKIENGFTSLNQKL